MTILKVHFDGKVLVPDEPVDLPRNIPLEASIAQVPTARPRGEFVFVEEDGFPVIQSPPGSPIITSKDVLDALEDDI